MTKIFKSSLTFVIFTIFLDSLGFGILIPIVPLLLADPSSRFYLLPANFTINQGYILLGLITAVFPLMQLFSNSIFGQISDKVGRRPILLYTLFFTSASYVLFAIGIALRNIPLLFFARAIAGVTSGNMSVAQAAIADLTLPKDRAKNFGLIGAAFGLGFILGPFLGGKLSDPSLLSFFNPTIPFYFAAILSFANAISVKNFFPETNKNLKPGSKMEWTKSLGDILKAFKLKDLRFLFLINFLFNSGFTFFVTFFSIYLIKKFNFSQGNIGDLFSFIGVCIAFTQIVLIRQLTKYFNEPQILRVTIIFNGIFIGLMYFVSTTWMLYALVAAFAVCNGLTFANISGLISRSADQKIQGEILGINASVQALAQLIPPVLSGFLAAVFAPETPIIVASTIIILSGLLFSIFYKPNKIPDHIPNY